MLRKETPDAVRSEVGRGLVGGKIRGRFLQSSSRRRGIFLRDRQRDWNGEQVTHTTRGKGSSSGIAGMGGEERTVEIEKEERAAAPLAKPVLRSPDAFSFSAAIAICFGKGRTASGLDRRREQWPRRRRKKRDRGRETEVFVSQLDLVSFFFFRVVPWFCGLRVCCKRPGEVAEIRPRSCAGEIDSKVVTRWSCSREERCEMNLDVF